MRMQESRYIRLSTTNHNYHLSKKYSIDDIYNKVINANENTILKFIDGRGEVLYIKASMIESIGFTVEYY